MWHTPLFKIIFSLDNLEEHLWKAQPQLVRKACGRMWYVFFQWILHAQIEILKAFMEKNSIRRTSKSLKSIYWCNGKQGLFSHFSIFASCTISEVKWVMKRSMCYKMGHQIPLRCVESAPRHLVVVVGNNHALWHHLAITLALKHHPKYDYIYY